MFYRMKQNLKTIGIICLLLSTVMISTADDVDEEKKLVIIYIPEVIGDYLRVGDTITVVVYDEENWNKSYYDKKNNTWVILDDLTPISGATVTFNGEEYITDNEGKTTITLDVDQPGVYSLKASKEGYQKDTFNSYTALDIDIPGREDTSPSVIIKILVTLLTIWMIILLIAIFIYFVYRYYKKRKK